MKNSYLFTGTVFHKRFLPKKHFFQYGLVLFYLDLDELHDFPSLPPLYKFREKDYLKDHRSGDLKSSVRKIISEKSDTECRGPIRIMTQISYLGFCFNPVSFYYCFDEADTKVQFILVEITNTPWNETEIYVLECQSDKDIEQFIFPKNFHVSPFMPMELEWDWKFQKPNPHKKQDSLFVHMEDWTPDRRKLMFNASLKIKPRSLTRSNILKMILLSPLLTLRPFIAIYIEALLLKLKGIEFHDHPNKESRL